MSAIKVALRKCKGGDGSRLDQRFFKRAQLQWCGGRRLEVPTTFDGQKLPKKCQKSLPEFKKLFTKVNYFILYNIVKRNAEVV